VPLYASNDGYRLKEVTRNQKGFYARRCHFMLQTGAVLCFKSQVEKKKKKKKKKKK
jgi:hypothetical protein